MHVVQASLLRGAPDLLVERLRPAAAQHDVRAVDADADLPARHALEEVEHVVDRVRRRLLPVVDGLDGDLDAPALRVLAELVATRAARGVAGRQPFLQRVAPDRLPRVGDREHVVGEDDRAGHDVAAERGSDVDARLQVVQGGVALLGVGRGRDRTGWSPPRWW